MRTLVCPHCGFSKEIPARSIPSGTARVTCPKCRQRFVLDPPVILEFGPPETPAWEPPEPEEQPPEEPPPPPEPIPTSPHQAEPAPVAREERDDLVEMTCPHCGTSREVLRAKIPPRQANVFCRECQKDFTIQGELLREPPPAEPPPVNLGQEPADIPESAAVRHERRKLSGLGELFSRSWDVFTRRIFTLIGINLLGFLLAVAAYFFLGSGFDILKRTFGDNPVVEGVAGLVLVGFSLLVVSAIGAAMTYAVVDEDLGVRESLGYGIQKFLSFLWVFSLLGFILVGGYLAFFLPGLLFTVWFCFAQFVLAQDDVRGMEALLKSREYVRGHGWGVLGRILLIGILGAIVSAIPFLGPLLGLAVGPFTLIFYYEIFRDLKEIKPSVGYPASRGAKTKWLLAGGAGFLVLPILGLLFLGPTLRQGLNLRQEPGPPAAAIQPAEKTSSLSLAQTVFSPGETLTVRFIAPEGLPSDAWIGIVPSEVPHGDEDRNDQHDLIFQYLQGRTGGILEFSAPDRPGRYDLRMNDTDGNGKEITSVSFEVVAGASQEISQVVPEPAQPAPTTSAEEPSQSPETVVVPPVGKNPGEVMVYVYSINYQGSVRLNGREIYPLKGEKDMNYNFTSSFILDEGANLFEVEYQSLPDPWMTKLQLKVYRYDWDSGQETVLADWTIQDPGGKRTFEMVLGN